MTSSNLNSSPPAYTLRHDLRPGDLGAILSLHATLYAQECGYDLTFEGYVAQTLAHFAQPYHPAQERIWLAEIQGRLVGCIGIIRHSAEQARLRWFLVAPTLRGKGLGRRLLQEAVRFAQEAGYASLFLETVEELPAAAHLYRAVGFVKTAERQRILWGQPITEQRYALPLQREQTPSQAPYTSI
jgi:GNAT superfamily N-acetyltransferase